jgi:Kef-type K+ transport system membrane component KefB
MIALTILVAAAALGLGIARLTRIPAIPLLLAAGVATAVAGGIPDRAAMESVLILGLTLLAFVMGLEMNPSRTGIFGRPGALSGIAQFLVVGAAGIVVTRLLGFAWLPAAYIALALTCSSTLVGVRLLRDRKQLTEPHGRMSVGILLVQDLLVLLLLPALALSAGGLAGSARGVGSVLLLMAAAAAALRWLTPLLLRLELDEERLLLSVLAVLFLFVGAASALELPLIAGGFLAGVSLSSFPASGILREQLDPISDFFAAVFFVALGAIVGVPTLPQLGQALLLAAIVVVLTPGVVTVAATHAGVRRRPALESGLLLAQTSEFSLVVGLVGLAAGHLDANAFTIVALVTVITMTATPFLSTERVAWTLLRGAGLRQGTPERVASTGHVVLLGSGENGSVVLDALRAAGVPVTVVEDEPAIVAELRSRGVDAIRGDATDRAVLERAGIGSARAVVSTLRRTAELEPLFEAAAGRIPVLVRVFSDEEADAVRAYGATPVLYAEAAADDFLRWFEAGGPAEADGRRA